MMAFVFHSLRLSLLVLILSMIANSQETTTQQPPLDSAEQESVYRVLDSLNPTIPWRSIYPDDLCLSAPHGVVCDLFSDSADSPPDSVHVTELSLGYVSDNSPNPPCHRNSTLSPLVFTSFRYLRKLFLYHCFNDTVSVSPPSLETTMSFAETLEELVVVDCPFLVGPLSGILRNFPSLRRVVLTGTSLSGSIPETLACSVNLEELTLSRNKLSGELPPPLLSSLPELKILDLSHNNLTGAISEAAGQSLSKKLIKLDLSFNGFSGKVPESLGGLKRLEFLDLSFNGFRGFGIPRFLPGTGSLREVYLSGNHLGGVIPDTWRNQGGLVRIGFSDMGLVGEIPSSMGVYLKNLSYLGLEDNNLEGSVPAEFGLMGSSSCEINLKNNSLSGRVFFNNNNNNNNNSNYGFGLTLKLSGNPNICVDQDLWAIKNASWDLGEVKLCDKSLQRPTPVPLDGTTSSSLSSSSSSSFRVFTSMVVLAVSWALLLSLCLIYRV